MFPNSANVSIRLLKTNHVSDTIGQKKLTVTHSKEVIGILFSVTSKEFYESKSLNAKIDMALKIQSILYDGSKYAIVRGVVYRIERTYLKGQFVEMYLVETNIKVGDLIDNTG